METTLIETELHFAAKHFGVDVYRVRAVRINPRRLSYAIEQSGHDLRTIARQAGVNSRTIAYVLNLGQKCEPWDAARIAVATGQTLTFLLS